MKQVTQPTRARGRMLSAVAMVAALTAFLAFAPFASAASDPLASGTTTIKLNKSFFKKLTKSDVKVLKVKPATVKKQTVKFPVNGKESQLDPLTGQGTITLSGGIKFKHGKKSASVKALVLNTTGKSLTAKVAGTKMKLASVSGVSVVRAGFGANVSVKKLKLTGKAAKQLNKKLGFGSKEGKKHKRASASSKDKSSSEGPFKGGQVMGSSTSETQPQTVTVGGGNASLTAALSTTNKLKDVEVEIQPIAPTTGPTVEPGGEPLEAAPTWAFSVTGGAISPTATAGTVQTSGGLKLVQKLKTGATTFITTEITLANIWVDFTAKTATVEVSAKSDASEALNLGNLGRSSIADINMAGATVTSDATSHTVSVQNAAAAVQPVSAEVLEGFVKVYEGYVQKGLEGPPFNLPPAVAKEKAEERVKEDHIKAGDPLGLFNLTAQTQ